MRRLEKRRQKSISLKKNGCKMIQKARVGQAKLKQAFINQDITPTPDKLQSEHTSMVAPSDSKRDLMMISNSKPSTKQAIHNDLEENDANCVTKYVDQQQAIRVHNGQTKPKILHKSFLWHICKSACRSEADVLGQFRDQGRSIKI